MTEQQADKIIDLLTSIKDNQDTSYSDRDDIVKELSRLNSKIENLDIILSNIQTEISNYLFRQQN